MLPYHTQVYNDQIDNNNIHLFLCHIIRTGKEGECFLPPQYARSKFSLILIIRFSPRRTELVTNDDRRAHIIRLMHVHIQIDTIQCAGLLLFIDCVHFERHSMDVCTIYYAKIETGIAQSNRYDLFYATMDDHAHSTIDPWI